MRTSFGLLPVSAKEKAASRPFRIDAGGRSAALLLVGLRPHPRGPSCYVASAKSIVQRTIGKSTGEFGEIFTDARRIEHQAIEEAVRAQRQRPLVRSNPVLGAERAFHLETRAGQRS